MLLTRTQRTLMCANGRANARARDEDGAVADLKPVAKLFCPWGGGTWLLSELDPEDADLAFGLCDPGFGFPELGFVRLSELEALRGPGGLRIERDRWFRPTRTLAAYADAARAAGRIDA
jgi:glycine/D-amino acid oxidase-like deaminating enzyme